jgi:hypothetical protein
MGELGLLRSACLIAQYASPAAPSRVQGVAVLLVVGAVIGPRRTRPEALLMVLLSTTALAGPGIVAQSEVHDQPVVWGTGHS